MLVNICSSRFAESDTVFADLRGAFEVPKCVICWCVAWLFVLVQVLCFDD
jgi:hypothetical protein